MEMNEFLCQSCGSYFPNDASIRGTNKDSSMSDDYCKYCLINGEYGKPDETMEEMIESSLPWRLKSESMPDGYPDAETARAEMTKQFSALKRWEKTAW